MRAVPGLGELLSLTELEKPKCSAFEVEMRIMPWVKPLLCLVRIDEEGLPITYVPEAAT